MASGFWQGMERATGRAANTGMQLLGRQDRLAQQETQNAMQMENLQMNRESHEVAQRAAQMKQAEVARLGTLRNVREGLANLGHVEKEVQDIFIKKAGAYIQQGPVSGAEMISQGNFEKVWPELMKDKSLPLEVATTRGQIAKRNLEQISQAMQDEKLKPEQQQALMEKQKQYSAMLNKADNQVNMLRNLTPRQEAFSSLSPEEQKQTIMGTGKNGGLKIGGTNERLLTKMASGQQLTEAEQSVYEILNKKEKRIFDTTIEIMKASGDMEYAETAEEKKAVMDRAYNLAVALDKKTGGEDSVKKLPDGLTQETLDFNMKTYGKTREEVISAWNAKAGGK